MTDGWRLALGMLTVWPAAPPRTVGRDEARWAMLLAPLAVLPLAVAVGLVTLLPLPALVVGLLGVAVLVLGTRAFHVDGLSDTADGLTASYDRDRSLQVMRTGTSGPAGGATVLLVLGLQAASLASLAGDVAGAVLAGVLVCVSRLALWLTCVVGVPGARTDGLGGGYVGLVPVPLAVLGWVVAAVVVSLLAGWAGPDWWRGVLAVLLAVVLVLELLRRAVRRLGGTTGDVFGAAIELSLAALLVGLA